MKASDERDSYRIRISRHNTALRFPNKAPSVYTRSVANTLQLSYKRIGRLYSGPIIRSGVYERNRGEFLAMVPQREHRESRRRESERAYIDLSSSAPFRILDQSAILCKPTSIFTAYLARWKEETTIEDCERLDELDRLDRRQIGLSLMAVTERREDTRIGSRPENVNPPVSVGLYCYFRFSAWPLERVKASREGIASFSREDPPPVPSRSKISSLLQFASLISSLSLLISIIPLSLINIFVCT